MSVEAVDGPRGPLTLDGLSLVRVFEAVHATHSRTAEQRQADELLRDAGAKAQQLLRGARIADIDPTVLVWLPTLPHQHRAVQSGQTSDSVMLRYMGTERRCYARSREYWRNGLPTGLIELCIDPPGGPSSAENPGMVFAAWYADGGPLQPPIDDELVAYAHNVQQIVNELARACS